MGHDAEVPVILDRMATGHDTIPSGGTLTLSFLPTIMRKRTVGFRHAMRVFPLLDRIAAIIGGVHQLRRQTIDHRLVVAAARGVDDPANGKRLAALRADLDRHLIGCAADPARANLHT